MKFPIIKPSSSSMIVICYTLMIMMMMIHASCAFTPLLELTSQNKFLSKNHLPQQQQRLITTTSTSLYSSSDATNNNKRKTTTEEIENQMLSLQEEKSNQIEQQQESSSSSSSMNQHLKRQQQLFDELSSFFNSEDATPEEVKPTLSFIINKVLCEMINGREESRKRIQQRKGGDDEKDEKEQESFRILDVGCGVGALFPFYLQQANELNINHLDIVGLDLSSKMITFAKDNANQLLQQECNNNNNNNNSDNDNGKKYTFDFVQGDFVQLMLGEGYDSSLMKKDSIVGYVSKNGSGDNDDDHHHSGQYDAVVINACFGNFYDQEAVLTAASQCLKNDGILAITHPLGAQFVDKLKSKDPETVLHSLPSIDLLQQMIVESQQPLLVSDFLEEIKIDDDNDDDESKSIYYASMKKVPQRLLREAIYLRGPVDSGYGRGGKKLGIPTANLPCSLFSNALQNVPTGVYFGWAVVEGDDKDGNDFKKGRNDIHKAVVNVGYSPTFDGEENKEKIVEAHLIVDDGAIEGDFYGETMRLSLYGFLRPEMKFESFPALIEAIMNDKANARDALDLDFYQSQKQEIFLSDLSASWVGASGGDENASYQFGK